MPVSVIPSAEQTTPKQKSTARKRRRNQNVEIDELASLVPLAMPLVPPEKSLVPSSGKPPAIDKISVLRLTSTFLKLQNFMKDSSPAVADQKEGSSALNVLGLMEEAIDGFLIVLDKDANILYASETITGYVGLSQQDVIGQNLIDISHQESEVEIKDNLKPAATPPLSMIEESIVSQFRQFYVRFRSTVSPSRMQLSRFTSHTMVQVNGNLKVKLPPSDNMEVQMVEPSVIGFIGECRLIESASSILELSIPHSTFTMTKSLDMKIISVESTVKEIVGYDPEDIVSESVKLVDFFHPADYKRMVPCEKFLMRTGHCVSPHFRFLTSSGDWVWMQLEATLRYKKGTAIPQFWEVKARVLSQGKGKLKYIEQSELYASNPDPDQDMLDPHRDYDLIQRLKTSKHCKEEEGAKPIIDSLKSAQLPDSVLEPLLHARSIALSNIPKKIKPILDTNNADEFVTQRDQAMMKRNGSISSTASSPFSSLSPASLASVASDSHNGGSGVRNTPSPGLSVGRGSSLSASRNGSLSSASAASPFSSVSSPPISPPTQYATSPSPKTPPSVQSVVHSPPRLASAAAVQGGHIDGSTQTKLSSVPPGTQAPFSQAQRGDGGVGANRGESSNHLNSVQAYSQMMVAPSISNTPAIGDDQLNGRVQSPPSVGSVSSISSPPYVESTATMMTAQQNLSQSHLFGGNGSSYSETPSPCNSAISAVSSPPSVFSPETGTGLHTTTGSIPSLGSVPFQNFQTSNLIPQANAFNQHIPTDFNFNNHTSPFHAPSSQLPTTSTAFAPDFNSPVMEMETEMSNNSSSNSLLYPIDPVVQQLLDEMVTLNGDPNFNSMAPSSIQNGLLTTNSMSSLPQSHQPHANIFTPISSPPLPTQPQVAPAHINNTFAVSCDVAMTQFNGDLTPHLLSDPHATNTNTEVQDILQQFQ